MKTGTRHLRVFKNIMYLRYIPLNMGPTKSEVRGEDLGTSLEISGRVREGPDLRSLVNELNIIEICGISCSQAHRKHTTLQMFST